ncbi:MAG: FGGY-family carbohydrate kinase [Deltaproteobacteria bacterium]|nr:FGGY-family carbohydrate kinase [Deltaproteobacteria bacterium]
MTGDRCILAIDHGTSGVKVALVSVLGEVLGGEFAPTGIRFLPGGGAEQDPDEWWSALLDSTRRLLARGLVPPDAIAGVGCSSTYSSTVACDEAGRSIGPALTWLDSRGAPHVRRLMRGIVNVQGYGVSNLLRFIPVTGGGPTQSGKDDVAHCLFWREERPDVWRAARWFLASKDWFNLRLTGRAAASFDSATLFWCTDNRDAANVRYHPGLIRRLGLDPARLAPLARSTDVLGPLLPEVADAIGVPRGTPVVTGACDLQSACVGSGAVRDFEAHVYLGTSSWLLCHVPFKKTDVLHSIASLPSAIPGRWFAANEQDQAGGCLEFLIRNVLFHPSRLAPGAAPPADVWTALDDVAASVPPGSRGVVFTPWLNGEKSPIDDEHLRGGFHNLSVRTTMDDMVRAVFEGVACNLRWVLHHVERFCGRRLDPLNLVGGGARSEVWPRILADVLGRTVRRVEHPLHANARGAAFIAAVGLGHLRFEDVPALVRFDRVDEPCADAGTRAAYDRSYRAFTELARRMRPICRGLNAGSR